MARAQQASPKNTNKTDKVKPNRFAHTQNTKYGMGDYYGPAIKAKVGRVRKGWGINPASQKQLKTPPTSLA